MFTANNSRTNADRRTTRLGVERLEDRSMPAVLNYLVLDFTPDYHSGSFADTFYNTRTASGAAPRFLDFNGDGWVNSTDVSLAMTRVTNRVAGFYAPFINNPANNLRIEYGDLAGRNWGFDWMKYGVANHSVEVAVMYFGGTSNRGSHVLGRAPLAGAGENIECFGETYTRSIAASLMARGGATPQDFVNKVANTAAHELGHMMGLRHTMGHANSIMNGLQSYTPGTAYFVNGALNTTNGYQQNGYAELLRSFQLNQRQITPQNHLLGGQFQTESGCEHELEHEHEHEDTAALDGVRLAPEPASASGTKQGAEYAAPEQKGRVHHIKEVYTAGREAGEPARDSGGKFGVAVAATEDAADEPFDFLFSVPLS